MTRSGGPIHSKITAGRQDDGGHRRRPDALARADSLREATYTQTLRQGRTRPQPKVLHGPNNSYFRKLSEKAVVDCPCPKLGNVPN